MVPQDSVSIHNIESEKAVLGSVLLDSKALIKAKSWIQDDDYFYNTKNKTIWKAMCDLDSEGIAVDTVSVCAKVKTKLTILLD